MDENQVDKLLHKARDHIVVDKELKETLRTTLLKKKRATFWKTKKSWVFAASAAVLFLSLFLTSNNSKQIYAEELNITNSISFFDIGSGDLSAYTHKNGKLYASIRNKGVYVYTDKGIEQISNLVADSMSFNETGEILLLSQNGNIIELDIKSGQQKMLLEKTTEISYMQPIWKNNEEIIVVKELGGKKEIVQISLASKNETFLAEGTNPSFIESEATLLFEHEGTIFLKNVKNDTVKKVDDGTQPSFSKDYRYISYVKENNNMEDIWIIDKSLKTKKKITNNLPGIEGTPSLYDYNQPLWDSEQASLYVIKQSTTDNQYIRLMKIEFNIEPISAKATVERFLQALIVRDDDYAKSLMEHPPEFLTYSNPHFTGYNIVSVENVGDQVFVTADVSRADTARPYYSNTQYKYELKLENERYMITNVEEVSVDEVASIDLINLEMNGKKQESLFSLHDLPKEHFKNSNIRLSSVAFDKVNDRVIFGVQEMEDESKSKNDEKNQPGVTIWSFDLKNKTFNFIDRIEGVLGGLTISSNGESVALDIFNSNNAVHLYDLKEMKKITKLENAYTLFWNENILLFERMNQEHTSLYKYNLATNETEF